MNSLPNLLSLNGLNNCVINTDLDGFLSGLFLQNFLNTQIIGFSDSAETIWIDNKFTKSLDDVIFIDIFLAPEKLKCIDQHIVSVDENHNNEIRHNKNKLNPNVLRGRYFLPSDSYRYKYPFGTLHFLIALMEKNGIDIDVDLNYPFHNNMSLFDLLLRADDALLTSTFSSYTKNADDWWQWLFNFSERGKITAAFYDFIKIKRKKFSERQIRNEKKQLRDLFTSSPFYCSSGDGGYKSEEFIEDNKISPNAEYFMNFLSAKCGLKPIKTANKFKKISGIAKRSTFKNSIDQSIIKQETDILFSYAFVRTDKRADNFSYTLMDKRQGIFK